MKTICLIAVFALSATGAFAQSWEAGVSLGGGFYGTSDLTSSAGTAAATWRRNLAGSVWVGKNAAGHFGGEVRYDYQRGNMDLSQGATRANFRSDSQAIHYDMLWHFTDGESSVRPFVSAGGGVKAYRGTGNETAFQPLSKIALLTKATDLVPMISVGAGIKARISDHVQLRLEVHDFITPFPTQTFTPVNAKGANWVHDIVPAVGLAFLF